MKKLMFIAAAALSASVFADIQSSNIVGYSSQEALAKNTFYIGNAPFEGVGSDGVVDVTKLLVTSAAAGTFNTMNQSPVISFLDSNGVTYSKYYLISDAYDSEENEVTGWSDEDGDLAEGTEIACGTAFWFKAPAEASSFTVPGQVMTDASVTRTMVKNQFYLLGNPYPVALTFDKIETTVAPGSFSTMNQSPVISVLDPNGVTYTKYFYISDAYDADENEVTGWSNEDGDIVDEAVCQPQQGFWIKTPSAAGNVTFKL